MQYVPRAFRRAGAKYLTLDFESYMTCNDKDYGWIERNRARDMTWGGNLPWDPILDNLRREYREKLQPITEGSAVDVYRPLVDKFWYHLTNSANSDGRWPPPPARTCEFNRNWVLAEIEATKQALSELHNLAAERGDRLPEMVESDATFIQEPGVYGHFFTDKETTRLEALNFYELGHALYAAFKAFDGAPDELAKSAALDRIKACYDAYQERGFEHMLPPAILADGGETKKR